MSVNKNLKSGDLIIFKIKNKTLSPEGLAMGGDYYSNKGLENDKLILYEEISIENFPSCNDFLGKKIAVEDGDLGMIIRYIGRPFNVIEDNDIYDIYEVITSSGQVCQVFKLNLALLHLKNKNPQ